MSTVSASGRCASRRSHLVSFAVADNQHAPIMIHLMAQPATAVECGTDFHSFNSATLYIYLGQKPKLHGCTQMMWVLEYKWPITHLLGPIQKGTSCCTCRVLPAAMVHHRVSSRYMYEVFTTPRTHTHSLQYLFSPNGYCALENVVKSIRSERCI